MTEPKPDKPEHNAAKYIVLECGTTIVFKAPVPRVRESVWCIRHQRMEIIKDKRPIPGRSHH